MKFSWGGKIIAWGGRRPSRPTCCRPVQAWYVLGLNLRVLTVLTYFIEFKIFFYFGASLSKDATTCINKSVWSLAV